MATGKALIPTTYDQITAQQSFSCDGNGSMNFIGVPQNAPSGSRAFRVLNAVLFIFSNNSNGTEDNPYGAGSGDAPGWIVPFSPVNPGDIPTPALGQNFPLASLGPAVTFTLIDHNAGAGENRSIWIMDSNREVVCPFGNKFGVWVKDSADGTPHNLTLTLFCQIQWLESDCAC